MLALGGFAFGAGSAAAPKHWLFAVDRPGEDHVAYSECAAPDVQQECAAYDLGCSDTGGTFTVYDGAALARKILASTKSPSRMVFTVGRTATPVQVFKFEMAADELDAGWGITFADLDMADIFKLLAAPGTDAVSVSVAHARFDLTPRKDDRPLLAALAAKCLARGSQ